MSEYIERETLLKHTIALNNPHELGENVVPVSDIEDAPAADVETVVHGDWIYKGKSVDGKKVYECSACHANIYATGPYCKECGAKMIGKEDET